MASRMDSAVTSNACFDSDPGQEAAQKARTGKTMHKLEVQSIELDTVDVVISSVGLFSIVSQRVFRQQNLV